MDYTSGAGGATVEATVYRIGMPSLAYVPVYSSQLPPTGALRLCAHASPASVPALDRLATAATSEALHADGNELSAGFMGCYNTMAIAAARHRTT